MAFSAKYSGVCVPCGHSIEQGEMITNHPKAGYVHEECIYDVGQAPEADVEGPGPFDPDRVSPERFLPRGKTAKDKCVKCFMIHSPGQETCE